MNSENTAPNSSLVTWGFTLILIAFGYLAYRLSTSPVPLNIITWTLWVVIDVSLLVSIRRTGNMRPWTVIGFVIGALLIAMLSVYGLTTGNAKWKFGWTEGLASTCAVAALLIWKNTTGFKATVWITVAMYVAMIPTLVGQWHNPVGHDPWFWLACSIGSFLEVLGKPKTKREIFFPTCATVANGLAAAFCFRQYFL